jgi:hypothetical protein
MPDATRELTPDARAKKGAYGTPIVLADGNAWLLADGGLLNDLDGLRDEIDDSARLVGTVPMLTIYEAAAQLLDANYLLSRLDLWSLLSRPEDEAEAKVVDQRIADAVFLALYGEKPEASRTLADRRTYTQWVASALLANGIDPTGIPTSLLPHVLEHLEATRRCVPREQFIESAEAGAKMAGIRARACAKKD